MYSLRDVVKTRSAGGVEFRLRVPRLDIERGAKIALVGHSGCGKSTLLDMLAMILSPSDSAAFHFSPDPDGQPNDLARLWRDADADALSELRKRHIGYVLQTGGLLPYVTVRDNIELSRRLLRLPENGAVERIATRLNITDQLDKLPDTLSVGQRQRVAIARALAHEPSTIIADEPTASIDAVTAEKVMYLLVELTDLMGVTLIIASHELALVDQAGLVQIEQYFEHIDDNGVTESVFSA